MTPFGILEAVHAALAADAALATLLGADGTVSLGRVAEYQIEEFSETALAFVNVMPPDYSYERERDANGAWIFNNTFPITVECFTADTVTEETETGADADVRLWRKTYALAECVIDALFVRSPDFGGVSLDACQRVLVKPALALAEQRLGAAAVTFEIETQRSLEWDGTGAVPLTRLDSTFEIGTDTVTTRHGVNQD